MAGTMPEAWVGRRVKVMVDLAEREQVSGTLEGADEKGIVVLRATVSGERSVFYPWRLVAWMHPTGEEGEDIGGLVPHEEHFVHSPLEGRRSSPPPQG